MTSRYLEPKALCTVNLNMEFVLLATSYCAAVLPNNFMMK